jgi:hypothetical protein
MLNGWTCSFARYRHTNYRPIERPNKKGKHTKKKQNATLESSSPTFSIPANDVRRFVDFEARTTNCARGLCEGRRVRACLRVPSVHSRRHGWCVRLSVTDPETRTWGRSGDDPSAVGQNGLIVTQYTSWYDIRNPRKGTFISAQSLSTRIGTWPGGLSQFDC